MSIKRKVSIVILSAGVILFFVGLLFAVPGDELTTYSLLSNKYSVIHEYVGGDAYNYIIGASLVAGKISGILAMKAIFIAMGILISCIGLVCFFFIADDKTASLPEFNGSVVSSTEATLENSSIPLQDEIRMSEEHDETT